MNRIVIPIKELNLSDQIVVKTQTLDGLFKFSREYFNDRVPISDLNGIYYLISEGLVIYYDKNGGNENGNIRQETIERSIRTAKT